MRPKEKVIFEAPPEKPLLLSREDLPEEAREILNFPEKPLVLPLNPLQMMELTSLSYQTILKWTRQGIIGQKPTTRWQFNQEDVLIAVAIFKRGKRLSPEEKKKIAVAIRNGQLLEELLQKPKEVEERPMGQGEKRKRIGIKQKTRERLTQHRDALKESQLELTEPLGLRKAAQFIREVTQGGYPSHTSLDKLIKIAVILGDFPLPPEVIWVSTAGNYWHYKFTDKRQLITVFDATLEIVETRDFSLEKVFQQAKKTFQEEREKRVPIEELMPFIFQQLSYSEKTSEAQKIRTKKFLIKKLQEGKLPLHHDVNSQEVLIFGVLSEDQDCFIAYWAEFVKEKMEVKGEILSPRTRLVLGRKEKSVHPLGSGLQEIFERKKRSIYTKYAAFYLQKELEPYGVEIFIIKHPNGVSYDCFVEEETYKKLMNLRQKKKFAPIFAKAEVILENGFQSLEEYQEYCPSDFLVSLKNGLKLLGASVFPGTIGAKIEKIKNLFEGDLQEVEFGLNKKTGRQRRAYYLTLNSLERLTNTPELKETLIKIICPTRKKSPIESLYLKDRGKFLSLTDLLRKADFEKISVKRIKEVYEFLRDKLEIHHFRDTYQILIIDQPEALEIIQIHWQAVRELLA